MSLYWEVRIYLGPIGALILALKEAGDDEPMEEGGNGEGGDEDDNDDSDSEGEDGVIVTIDQKRIEEDKTKTIQSMQVNPGLYIFLY